MKKIRLLWLLGAEKRSLNEPEYSISGAQTKTLQIFKNLDPSTFSIFIGIDGYSPLVEEFKKYAKVVPFRTRNLIDIRALKRLKNVIEKEKIDILHTQGMRHSFLSFLLGKKKGFISVLTRHIPLADEFYPKAKKLSYGLFDRCSLEAVDAIVTVAEYGKKRIVETRGRINPMKIRVIHNGIDVCKFNPDRIELIQVRKEFAISPKANVVATIAALTARKNHRFLLQAASEIVKKFPNTIFLLVGDGNHKETLVQIVEGAGLQGNVIFAGFRNDVQEILRISDLMVLPSLSEGFPNVILEAMAMKKPVVATEIAGVPEMIDDGKNGYLVQPGNVGELARRIMEILENKKLGVSMGKIGYQRVIDKFNTKRMTNDYEKLYIDLYKSKMSKE